MRSSPDATLQTVKDLFELLLSRPKLMRGPAWKTDWTTEWTGWSGEAWQPERCGVYVLWRNEDDLELGNRPVYVGEGIIGTRVWDSFQNRPEWQFAQILYDERISGPGDGIHRRRLLERFAIVVLDPKENRG